MMLIAHVVLPVHINRHFDYLVNDDVKPVIGGRVNVPFGHRNSVGIVTQLDHHSQLTKDKLKPILTVIDKQPVFNQTMWQMLNWAADYYHYPLGEVLFHALPVLLRQGRVAEPETVSVWSITETGKTIDINTLGRSPRQQQILAYLQQQNAYHHQQKTLEWSRRALKQLMEKRWVKQIECSQEATPFVLQEPLQKSTPLILNNEQQQAVIQIIENRHWFVTWLLDGVTGSGKTEVYLQVIAACLAKGQQILVLVPEISLTPQTINRFKSRFNVPIDVLHSGINDSERFAVWLRSQRGENAIVIGTRSALFTPFVTLGMIIVDEEHDHSYKQQEGWLYHARDLAIVRAKLEQVPVILGSATPSLESLHNAQIGKYTYLQLTTRAGNATPVQQSVIDLKGRKLLYGLSQPLIDEIKIHLRANNQVMLFINRRGYAPVLMCHGCGWIAECDRCERHYTLHKKINKLCCHHCDAQQPIPPKCPTCQEETLITVGVGTEQLSDKLNELFPDSAITRIDRDTTSRKGELDAHLQEIEQGGARILIGTKILAKGHHFPNVTLVGIIDVDGSLFSTDFRAIERFAQLYVQVAGRSGREDKKGKVILQTHHPDHPQFHLLLSKGYLELAKQILVERCQIGLPPFSYQAVIKAKHFQSATVKQFLQQIKMYFLEKGDQELELLGPMAAIYAKQAGKYRWQLIIQHPNRAYLQAAIKQSVAMIEQHPLAKRVRWTIDVDPIEMA